MEIRKWKRYFAWLPVTTQLGDKRWLCFVQRKNINREGGKFYVYSDIHRG